MRHIQLEVIDRGGELGSGECLPLKLELAVMLLVHASLLEHTECWCGYCPDRVSKMYSVPDAGPRS